MALKMQELQTAPCVSMVGSQAFYIDQEEILQHSTVVLRLDRDETKQCKSHKTSRKKL